MGGVVRNWSDNARKHPLIPENFHSNMLGPLKPELFPPHTPGSRREAGRPPETPLTSPVAGAVPCMRTIRFFHHMVMAPGKTHIPTGHKHEYSEEIFYIIRGVGDFKIGDKTYRVKPGDVVYIPPMDDHLLTNIGPEALEFIDFNVPVGEALKKLSTV